MNYIKNHLLNFKEASFPTETITLGKLADYTFLFLQDMKFAHLHAVGDRFEEIHNKAEELYDRLEDDLDTISEYAISGCCELNNFSDIRSRVSQDEWPSLNNQMIDWDAFINFIEDYGTKYLNYLLKTDVSASPAKESLLDDIKLFWDKQVNYINQSKKITCQCGNCCDSCCCDETQEGFTIEDGLNEAIPQNMNCFNNLTIDEILGNIDDVISN